MSYILRYVFRLAEKRPEEVVPLGQAVTPKSDTERERRSCLLSITDDRQPSPNIGWQLEITGSMNGLGITTWTVSHAFGRERETLGTPLTLRWSDDPGTGLSDHLIRFAEQLPPLVIRWASERRTL